MAMKKSTAKMKRGLSWLLIVALMLSTFNFTFAEAAGTTTTWTGTTDSTWHTDTNWDAGLPQSTVDVVLPDTATNTVITLDGALLAAGKALVYNFTATDSGPGLTINMVNNPTLEVNRDFVAEHVTFTGSGTIRVGERGGTPYAGDATFTNCTVAPGIVLDVSGDLIMTTTTAGTVQSANTLTMTDSTLAAATVVGHMSATRSEVSSRVYGVGGNLTMTDNSRIVLLDQVVGDLAATVGSTVDVARAIGGTLVADQSTITMASPGTIGSSATLTQTATLEGYLTSVGGDLSANASTIDLDGNPAFNTNISGNLTLVDSGLTSASGYVNVTGALSATSASTIDIGGNRSLAVGTTTDIDATSTLTLNTAQATFTGAGQIEAGGIFNLNGSNQLSFLGGFSNLGTLNVAPNTYQRITAQNGSLKLNNTGAIMDILTLNTANVTLVDTAFNFIRNDSSSFNHSGSLNLENSDLVMNNLRLNQASLTGHTLVIDGNSTYTYEALGKFSDANRNKINTIGAGTNLYITVEDVNKNITNVPNTLQVTVESASGDSELVTLTETGNSTGIFINAAPIAVAVGGGFAANNATLTITEDNENITGTYVDGAETTIIRLVKPYVIWDGAVDNDWFTAGNWTENRVPNATDNVRITGNNGPYVTNAIQVLALETDNAFTGEAVFYGSTTQLESLNHLGGNVTISSTVTITGDVTVNTAQELNLTGYNNSSIGGNVNIDGLSSSLTLGGNSMRMDVLGTTTVRNVAGNVNQTYLDLRGAALYEDNSALTLNYNYINEPLTMNRNVNVSSNDNTYEKTVTANSHTNVSFDDDVFKGLLTVDESDRLNHYRTSTTAGTTISDINMMTLDDSQFKAISASGNFLSVNSNDFEGATSFNGAEQVNSSNNSYILAPITLESAKYVYFDGGDSFSADATFNSGAFSAFTGDQTNSSQNRQNTTYFNNSTFTFVGDTVADATTALDLNDATLNFAPGTVLNEMIAFYNDGTSTLKNVEITFPRDEYAYVRNQGQLTLDNAKLYGQALMTNDLVQTGSIIKANGGAYTSQGLGYFGTAAGQITDDIGANALYFYMLDHDANLDQTAESLSVNLSDDNGVIEALVLTETGNSTGIFKAEVPAQHVGNALKVVYEGRTIKYKATPFAWSGAAANDSWYDAANWVGNIVPLEFDSVTLASTGDTILLDDITSIQKLTLASTFTGTLRRTQGSLQSAQWTQQGGTFSDQETRNHAIKVLGHLDLTGGTISRTSSSQWQIDGHANLSNSASMNVYNVVVKGDVNVEAATLTTPSYLESRGTVTANGTLSGGTFKVTSAGALVVNGGTLNYSSLDNDSTLVVNAGTLGLGYHYQDLDMTQNAGDVTVTINAIFPNTATLNLKSGNYILTSTGNVGNLGHIVMDGGLFDAYGYGAYYGNIDINSGRMRVNSRGANTSYFYNNVSVNDYGILNFGNTSTSQHFQFYKAFNSTGTYSFGPTTYLYLTDGSSMDLQNKLLEVFYLTLSGNVTVSNGTLKIKNAVNSTLNKQNGSVLTLQNATLDAVNAYSFTNLGSTVLDQTSRFARKTQGLNIVDLNSNASPHLFTFGSTFYALVEDESANQNSGVIETITLNYKNVTSNETESITLTEINANSKKFVGSIPSVAIDLGTAASQPGVAEGSNGRGLNKVLNFKDQIILKYIDARTELEKDVFEVAFNGALLALGSTDVDVEGSGIDFGIAYVGEYAEDGITIYNRGDVTLEIPEIWIEGDADANFKFAGSGTSRTKLGGTIKVAPKSQVKVSMVFEAETPGIKTATLKFRSNDIQSPIITMNVTGTAGYRPLVVQPMVEAAAYSGTVGAAGALGARSVNLNEFFQGRNNQDPMNIKILSNSNTALFDQFSFNANTGILSYTLKSTNGIAPVGDATISVMATDTLGFSAETAFGLHVYAANNAQLLKLGLVNDQNEPLGTWDATFDADTLTYRIDVPVEVGSASISATAVNENATVTLVGDADFDFDVQMGNNVKTVRVVSEDTTKTKDYVLTIVRPQATLTGTGPSNLIFEAGQAENSLALDESMRVNGAEKIEIYFVGGYQSTQDELIYTVPQGSSVTAAYNAEEGKITLTGTGQSTAKDYNDILKSIRYQNTSESATAGNRTVRYLLYFDGNAVQNLQRSVMVNYAPVVKDQTFVHVVENGNLVKALNATDKDNDVLTFEMVTPPLKEADGAVAMNGLTFTYVPKNGETGLDSFVYRVTDGKSYSDYGTITVNLVSQNNQGLAPLVKADQVESGSYRDNLVDAFTTTTLSADITTFFEDRSVQDPQNREPLSYKLVFNSNEDLFESFAFDANTGALQYVIKKEASTAKLGTALITFEAMDALGYVAEATMVVQVTEAVAILYKIGDDKDNVTGNLTLPSTAPSADEITWTSSREDIIAINGNVVRPLKDTVVKLTAQVNKNGFLKWIDFYVTVKGTSVYDKVTDQGDLVIGYAQGEDANGVKSSIFLPKLGTTGCTVAWSSDAPGTISNTGKITRPSPEGANANVTLTATLTDPDTNLTTTKQFVLTVLKLTDKEAAEEAARKMTIALAASFANGDIWESVTEPFILLETGLYNTQITWESSLPSVISLADSNGDLTGTITRPAADTNVILTATFTKGVETATKTFLVIVKAAGVTKDPADVRVDSQRTAQIGQTLDGVDAVNTTTIYRTELSSGTVIDTIIIQGSQLDSLIENIDPNDPVAENRTINIEMTSPLNDEPDEIAVEMQADGINAAALRNADLVISTPVATVVLENSSLRDLADQGTDLYFRVRPITDPTEKDGLKVTVVSDAAVKAALPAGKIAEALSTPLKIETNMTNVPTVIRVPLTEIEASIPLDTVATRDAFLQSLSIYVRHSDGENKVYTPTVVYDADGKPVALTFTITKFSTFQIFKSVATPAGSDYEPKSPATPLPGTVKPPFVSYGPIDLETLKKYQDQGIGIEFKTIPQGPFSIILSPGSIDVAKILTDLGGQQLKDISLSATTTALTDDQYRALKAAVLAQGGSLVGSQLEGATQINIVAQYQDKKLPVDLNKLMQVTSKGLGNKITTGILFHGGSIYHQPTVVTYDDATKTYGANISSFEQGIFAVIYKELIFADAQGHWSQATVNNQAGRLVAFGTTATSPVFGTNKPITRAEYATWLVRALGFTPRSLDIQFKDVPQNAWYRSGIETAYQLGFIKGYNANEFKPNQLITRGEAMAMLARAMQKLSFQNSLTTQQATTQLGTFADSKSVPTWVRTYVLDALANNILKGKGSNLSLGDNTTRAEALVWIERMLKASGVINQ